MATVCCTWLTPSPKCMTVLLYQRYNLTLIKTVSTLFLIICRSSGIRNSFKIWFRGNSWLDIKTTEMYEKNHRKVGKTRHSFEDSFNANIHTKLKNVPRN